MRILLYCPNYLPATRYGGPIQSSHGLAKALVAQGHVVHVFTTNVDGRDRIDAPLAKPVDIDGVSVWYFAIQTPRRVYYAPAMGQALEAVVGQFDVVHTNGMFLWPGPKAARAAVHAGTPVVVSPRGMLMPELIIGRSTLAKKIWILAFERRHLSQAAAIHVTSEEEADGVRRLGLDRAQIVVIGNGVDLPDVPPDQAMIDDVWAGVPPGSRVAFLGRLDWTKGVDLAIKACAGVPGARLLIAGPDQIGLRAELEPTITYDTGGPCARFIGPISGPRKWAFLAGADILLAPSVKESFGMSVAEALAMATPVVCTEGVGAKTIVGALNRTLVTERDHEALARVVSELLAAPERCADIGRRAASLIRRDYSWDSIAAQMTRVYAGTATRDRTRDGNALSTNAA
jgi:glycosyltransferase involved in cell wall biosynthesis